MTDNTELQKAAAYAAQDTIKFADEDEEMRALQKFHEEVDPETILALTAENESNRHEREVVCANYDQLKAENDQLFGETERLKAEVARSAEREILQLAEIEVLRKAFRPLLAHWDDLKAGESLNVDAARAAMGKGGQP